MTNSKNLTRSYIEEKLGSGYTEQTDHSDWQITYELPCGVEVGSMTINEGQPCDPNDCYLEGMDGFVFIDSPENLEKYMSFETPKELAEYLATFEDNKQYSIEEILGDYLDY